MASRSVEFEDTEQLDSDFFTEPAMAAEESAMIQLNSDLGAEIESVDPPGYDRSLLPTEAVCFFFFFFFFLEQSTEGKDKLRKQTE